MTDVTLTAAARSALVDLQRTAQLSQRARERLETGLRINRPIDDGPAFFLAQNLIDRAGDLAQVKSGIGQAATAIGGTLAGIDAIGQVVGQLKGIAQAARGGSPEARAEAARQFDRLRSQIDAIAADTGFGGVRLLTEPAQSLTVNFNGAGPGGLTIQGRPSQAQSLGIGAAAGDFNNFATDADLDAALAGLGNATGALRASAAALGSNAGLLNTRFAFTEDLTQALRTGAGKLIDADLDEEAARLVTLRVRDGLGAAGLAIAAQSQRALLQLF